MSLRVGVVLVVATSACAPKEDVTPAIDISPGARARIMVMDSVRHQGSPRRWLPKVTVEEIDDAETPDAPIEPSTTGETSRDGGSSPTGDAADEVLLRQREQDEHGHR